MWIFDTEDGNVIYLDNSATTMPAKEVCEAFCDVCGTIYGNPSSTHKAGREAAAMVAEARKKAADYLGCAAEEIYFTSGGTESDNIAVLGGANLKRGRRVVTTAIEHPAVLRAMEALEEKGFEVIKIVPEKDGSIDAEKVIESVNSETSLVSVMHVNNETGAVFDIAKIAAEAKKKAPRALIHTDAVQSFGHIETNVKKLNVDLMSVRGHKIHSVKGSGLLFVRKGVNNLKSPIYGGGQEKGIRSGTENTAAIHALGKAIELIDLSDAARAAKLWERLLAGLMETGKAVYNGGENCSPYILNVSFVGVRSEVMLNALDAKGIMVSSASACARGKGTSHVLKAMGAKYADNAIRFSMSRYTTGEEIEETIKSVCEVLTLYGR